MKVLELIFTIINEQKMIDIIKEMNTRFEMTKLSLTQKKQIVIKLRD